MAQLRLNRDRIECSSMIDSETARDQQHGKRITMLKSLVCQSRRASVAAILVGFSCHGSSLAYAQAVTAPPAPAVKVDTPRLTINIPKPMSDLDIDRYSKMLILSDPQIAFLKRNYSEYLGDCEALLKGAMPILDELSIRGGRGLTAAPLPIETFEIATSLRMKEQEVFDKLASFDKHLFEQLESVLADSQLPLLVRVRMHRERATLWRIGIAIPSASVDLFDLVEKAQPDAESLRTLDPILRDYEETVTPLFVSLNKTTMQNTVKLNELAVRRMRLDIGDDPQKAQLIAELGETEKDLNAKAVKLQMRILTMNEQFAARIFESAPSAIGRKVRQAYREMTYRDIVFPDYEDPEDLYQMLFGRAELTVADREAFKGIWDAYRSSYEAVCKKMVNRYNQWREEYAATSTNTGIKEYKATMRALRAERWTLSKRAIEQLKGVAPAPFMAANERKMDDFIATVDQAERNGEADSYPPW